MVVQHVTNGRWSWCRHLIAIAILGTITYFSTHYGLVAPSPTSAWLGLAAGIAWILATIMPHAHRRTAINLNRVSAYLTTLSAISLL
jgi:lauroyl/myristoyl acyltransferase